MSYPLNTQKMPNCMTSFGMPVCMTNLRDHRTLLDSINIRFVKNRVFSRHTAEMVREDSMLGQNIVYCCPSLAYSTAEYCAPVWCLPVDKLQMEHCVL